MVCERCNQASITVTMSFFNTDMICPACISLESKHPDYVEAKKAETDQTLAGNLNFPGVGLPRNWSIFCKAYELGGFLHGNDYNFSLREKAEQFHNWVLETGHKASTIGTGHNRFLISVEI